MFIISTQKIHTDSPLLCDLDEDMDNLPAPLTNGITRFSEKSNPMTDVSTSTSQTSTIQSQESLVPNTKASKLIHVTPTYSAMSKNVKVVSNTKGAHQYCLVTKAVSSSYLQQKSSTNGNKISTVPIFDHVKQKSNSNNSLAKGGNLQSQPFICYKSISKKGLPSLSQPRLDLNQSAPSTTQAKQYLTLKQKSLPKNITNRISDQMPCPQITQTLPSFPHFDPAKYQTPITSLCTSIPPTASKENSFIQLAPLSVSPQGMSQQETQLNYPQTQTQNHKSSDASTTIPTWPLQFLSKNTLINGCRVSTPISNASTVQHNLQTSMAADNFFPIITSSPMRLPIQLAPSVSQSLTSALHIKSHVASNLDVSMKHLRTSRPSN